MTLPDLCDLGHEQWAAYVWAAYVWAAWCPGLGNRFDPFAEREWFEEVDARDGRASIVTAPKGPQ